MTARMRRLASDYMQVKKDFAAHKNIIVTPIGDEPPEKYHVTYFVNGIYLLPDGRIETLGRHEIEIILHADYPRYKPICKILTPIWHPNFRDDQICIGDIWGAGESLSDIIINIGDMIQYKSWNSYSPLSADAAQWAMDNKHLFPVGNVDLYIADYASSKEVVEIDLFGDEGEISEAQSPRVQSANYGSNLQGNNYANEVQGNGYGNNFQGNGYATEPLTQDEYGNDFEITAEELEGIEFVPTAQRMQTVSHGGFVKGRKVNFKTILIKGLLWAFIGACLGFGVSELTDKNITSTKSAAKLSGHSELLDFYEYQEKADAEYEKFETEFERWCRKNNKLPDTEEALSAYFYSGDMSADAEEALDNYINYDDLASFELYYAYTYEYDEDEEKLGDALAAVTRISTAMWAAVIALFVGLFLGIGEGIYYGSKQRAVKYALIGAGISVVIGFVGGYLAQWMYAEMLSDDPASFTAALVRGLGWAIMGLGIGVAVGLIKPEKKRLLFCSLGGLVGAFIGGFLFNYIVEIIPDDMVARGVAIVVMGVLIGIGVGLLEQFAKAAWLKVIRGEFEGKEYLVFAGTTSIGNNNKNTIVLFKDKLVGPHHCDIKLEGSKYVLTDCGTPMGTIVNGQKTARHVLRQGDAIAIGNSVLVFNTK
ncbi:MAG: FHA domain-containing protein [Clostridia bacterium]|nr:FHA domain-containing protein [Clostridia bacterium]